MTLISLQTFILSLVLLILRESSAQNSTESCGPGKFLDSTNTCKLCAPGFFQNKFFPSVPSCQPCPPGTYFPIPGAQRSEACIPCPINTFSEGGAKVCSPCPKGTVSATGLARCDTCQPGQQVIQFSTDATTVCVDCPPNQFSEGFNNFRCQPIIPVCPPQQFLPPGSSDPADCQACPPGTEFGFQGDCQPCQPGTFNDGNTIDNRCVRCPAGFISNESASECTPCPPGTFQPPAPQIVGFLPPNECTPCEPGTEALGEGNPLCKPIGGRCPPQFFERRDGACRSCTTNERYSIEEDRCVPCEQGLFSTGGSDQVCKPCAQLPLPIQDDINCFEQSTIICFPGSERQGDRCVRCPPNTSQSSQGPDVKCEPCPADTSNLFSGDQCQSCPVCTSREFDAPFCSFVGLDNCNPSLNGCEEGFVLQPDENGDGQCECPAVVPREIAERCIICVPTVFGEGGETNRINLETQECERCSVFQSTDGFSPCAPCPDDSVNVGDGVCGCSGRQAQDRGIINGKCTVCPPGSVGVRVGNNTDNVCAPCPPGTFADPRSPPIATIMCRFCPIPPPKCRPCEDGFFNPSQGAAECQKCPDGFATFGEGAEECFPLQSVSVGPNVPTDEPDNVQSPEEIISIEVSPDTQTPGETMDVMGGSDMEKFPSESPAVMMNLNMEELLDEILPESSFAE